MSKIKSLDLLQQIKVADTVLIVGHVRPDGDCLGSGLALKRVCEKYGKKTDFLCDSDLPSHYSFLPKFNEVNAQKYSDYNLIIFVDCADAARAGNYFGYAKKCVSINIDHHATNNGFADYNVIDVNSSSSCEIVFKMLEAAGEVDNEIAFYLFTGLSTDTGHFMHSNTTKNTMDSAAALLKYNINVNEIGSFLYRNNTVNKTKLIARAINSMRFFCDNYVCIISISLKDLEECGCTLADTEGLTDYAMNIGEVKACACITEQNRPQYKVSYRSKGIDVSASAGVFGGGGHKLAAGCVVSGHFEDVIRKVVKSITDLLP